MLPSVGFSLVVKLFILCAENIPVADCVLKYVRAVVSNQTKKVVHTKRFTDIYFFNLTVKPVTAWLVGRGPVKVRLTTSSTGNASNCVVSSRASFLL